MRTQKKKGRWSWLNHLKQSYALDVRSLALLRMGLALIILTDLCWRLSDIAAYYSDQGVIPRSSLIGDFSFPSWYRSIHLLSDQPFVRVLLFLGAAILALAMLLGYRTRLATITSWAMLFSLNVPDPTQFPPVLFSPSPVLIFPGDAVLLTFMFWAMFLPLGAAYSVDSTLNPKSSSLPKKIFSGAVIAITIQQCFIYILYDLSFDQYVSPFGA